MPTVIPNKIGADNSHNHVDGLCYACVCYGLRESLDILEVTHVKGCPALKNRECQCVTSLIVKSAKAQLASWEANIPQNQRAEYQALIEKKGA
jgi:hypothetical protein